MDRASLTIERLRSLVGYDPETGVFTRLVATGVHGIHRAGVEIAKVRKRDGYLKVCVDSIKYEAGRLAWFYMTGAWPTGDVDHKDGNQQNNRWTNLRDVPHRTNIENRTRPNKNNRAGLLGVSIHPSKPGFFRAQITVEGRNKSLGTYESAELAHAAYVAAKRQFHEGNTL